MHFRYSQMGSRSSGTTATHSRFCATTTATTSGDEATTFERREVDFLLSRLIGRGGLRSEWSERCAWRVLNNVNVKLRLPSTSCRAATLTFPQLTASLTYAIFRDRRERAGGRRNDAGRHARNRHRWGRLEVAQRPGGAERPTTACTHAGHAFPFIEAAVDQCSQLPRGPVRCAAPPRPLSRQLTARTRLAASSSMPGARKRHSSWR